MRSCTLTLDEVREVLVRRGGGLLKINSHSAPPTDETSCDMCVRELRALACELPWSDHPDGHSASPTDRVCQGLNDAAWPNNEERTKYCLPLALLSEDAAPEGWLKSYCEQIIRQIVPIALRAAASIHPNIEHKTALEVSALRGETEGTLDAARAASDAASNAARAARAAASDPASDAASDARAARAVRVASDAALAASDAAFDAASDAARAASDAASNAARAARAAARAAASMNVLSLAVNLLLQAHGRGDLVQD